MDCSLKRLHLIKDGIFGILTIGNIQLFTLEHAYFTQSSTYEAKVAYGEYTCVRHPPNRLPYETFMLENVPDFENETVDGILIHIGNYNNDSIGCILLGKGLELNHSPKMITNSRDAFAQFMGLQKDYDKFTLTIC